jgi:hypothetical protein
MSQRCPALLAVLIAMAAGPVAAVLAATPTTNPTSGGDTEIAEAINQLGDPSYKVREQAQKKLFEMGQRAEPLLKAATESRNVEIADRAKVVLQRFELERFTFDAILESVHRAAEQWRKPDWKDPLLETAVIRLVEQVREGTGRANVRLPAAFDQVERRDGRDLGTFAEGGFYALTGGSITRVNRSILLIDGSLRISFAEDCLIIARGAVEISHGRRNVVLAGQYIRCGFDGDPRTGGGSLLMSGSALHVSHCNGSVCFAPHMRISHATETVFLNSPKMDVSHEQGCSVMNAKLPAAPREKPNPLAGKLKIRQIVKPDDSNEGAMVILQTNGVELVLRPGAAISDNQGKPIPELAGWTLSVVADGLALFTKGREDACFHINKR